MLKKWELLSSRPVFESDYISVYQDKLKCPNGNIVGSFFTVKRKDAAYIVALTAEKEVIIVRQYKNGAKDLVYEIPAGFVEENENPQATAERELLEETGFKGSKTLYLGSYLPNMGGSGSYNHYFLIRNAAKVANQNLDVNEDIEVHLISLRRLVAEIRARKSLFIDNQSQLALLLVWEELKDETTHHR